MEITKTNLYKITINYNNFTFYVAADDVELALKKAKEYIEDRPTTQKIISIDLIIQYCIY